MRVWDVERGHCLQVLTGHSDCVCCLQVLPYKNVIISGSSDSTVRCYDLRTRECQSVLEVPALSSFFLFFLFFLFFPFPSFLIVSSRHVLIECGACRAKETRSSRGPPIKQSKYSPFPLPTPSIYLYPSPLPLPLSSSSSSLLLFFFF